MPTAEEVALQWGVPQDAVTRLDDMRGRLATSDLSVAEFLLVREAGFYPLGLVMGASIFHVPYQSVKWNQSAEITTFTQAMYSMRNNAMLRMEAEANVLGADGIVGVRWEIRQRNWGNYGWEFVAIGTAVKADPDVYPETTWRNKKGLPFTSDLSGQAFWTLIQAGYAPLGMVIGNCAYHIMNQRLGGLFSRAMANQGMEIPEFTQGVYDARELAMSRMQAEAEALEAATVVEVKLTEHGHGWDSHALEFLAVGTAVRPFRSGHTIAKPTMTMPLTD